MNRDIILKSKELFAAGVHTELRAQINKSQGVSIISGNLTGNASSEVSGLSARVYKNGVYGFSSMAECTYEAARAVLEAATDNAVFMDSRVRKGTDMFPSQRSGFVERYTSTDTPSQKRYIDFARSLDSYITEKYPSLSGRCVMVRADSMEKMLVTSDGCDGYTSMPRSYVYISMTGETSNGTPVELMTPIGGFGTFDTVFTSPEALYEKIDRIYEKIRQKQEGIYPEAGLKTCILGGELAGMLAHEAVGHTVEADLVLGGSVAAHNLGREVASPIVSMVDFAHTFRGEAVPLPVYVDDEGVEAIDAPLITNGILTGYMNNRETAHRFGMTPTGNARAYRFSDEPLIRMRNTAILPGTSKLEDMIASIDDGYYFVDTNNGQADTTGEFMFGICMGYEIKNGKLGRALLDTTISGVAFEMLKTVDMLSDTMTWASSGFCGKKQPMPVGLGGPAVKCKVTVGGR